MYLKTHGVPRVPADLDRHECLILKSPASRVHDWTIDGPEGSVEMQVNGPVQVNIPEALAVAIREGMGIGMLPVYAAIEGLRSGTLVRVLARHTLQKTNVYALYPSRKYVDAKTKTWVECLRTYLPQLIARDLALLGKITQEQLAKETSSDASEMENRYVCP
ncbi:DNA-binding transcriptional LysR family regulator [Paraburkholderia sp. GAS348]|jgi:DNA-binding transcriptional LysR family regulator